MKRAGIYYNEERRIMAKSRYEKYIVRRPVPPAHAGPDEGIRAKDWVNTGALVLCDKKLFKGSSSIVEYGMVIGDSPRQIVSGGPQPHTHDYDELFIFLGTDPKDVYNLGAEVEMWLGEGKELEKIIINTSSSLFIPAGLAHLPQIWKNVTRPIIYLLVMFGSTDYVFRPASVEGRPMA
ncbi:MAG: hypothetical protein A2Z29_04435 [Chloroflexi bacterium RBG_16_56_11]|nr:MAG: hypothetical protein A2Z29_04435 [Chloroflexi bacterium RBG_16_56_11]